MPLELWQFITTFLDARSKRILRLANKEWFNVIKCDNFRIFFARNSNLLTITEHLSKYPNLISLSLVKNKLDMPANEMITTISVLTNLKSFIFKERLMDEDLTTDDWIKLSNLTNLEELEFLRWQSTPVELISNLGKLRKLVTSAKLKDLGPILKVTTNLECLKISMASNEFNMDPFIQLQHPSKLTKLYLRIQHAIQLFSSDASVEKLKQFCNLKVFQFEDFSINTIQLHLDQLTSLESIKYLATEGQPFHTNTNLTNLELNCSQIGADQLRQFSRLKKLRRLDMEWPMNATSRRFDFLASITDLQEFSIRDATPHNIRDKSKDRELVNYLTTNLNSLTGDFDVECLIRLEQLESLGLLKVTDDLDNLRYFTKLTVLDAYSAHNISTVNTMTALKSLSFHGRKVPRDYMQLNIEQLTNLEVLAIHTLPTHVNIINNVSKLTKLTHLVLSINFDDIDFKYDFHNLNLTYFGNEGQNNGEKLLNCLVKITTLNYLSFEHWTSEEKVLLLTALNHLTKLRLSSPDPVMFFGYNITALTNLQDLRGLGWRRENTEEMITKMPYLRYCS